MADVEIGSRVPAVPTGLVDATGEPHDLAAALARGPVVLGIYKSSCQASKTMFPFLERLHQRHAGHGLAVYGVSQDSPTITASFARRLGIKFAILIEPAGYPVTLAFGVTFTPTVYLLLPDGAVGATTMGFFKDPVNEFGDAVATAVGQPAAELFTAADTDVPIFVPG